MLPGSRQSWAIGAASFQLYALSNPRMRKRIATENVKVYEHVAKALLEFIPESDLPMSIDRFVRVTHALSDGLMFGHFMAPDQITEDVIVAAWAEPARLPSAGGQTQILVRLQKAGGAPFPGVQVRLRTSAGSLFSQGRVLVTDEAGRTRDRLTTRNSASITLNAGGTVYRFRIPVGAAPPPS